MKLQKIFGGILILLGGLSIIFSTQQTAEALVCNHGEPEAFNECVPPHAVEIQFYMSSLGTCSSSYYFWCEPDPGATCGAAGYALVLPGGCSGATEESSPTTTCVEDYGTLVVEALWYESHCSFRWGTCGCNYTIGGTYHPAQYVEMCCCVTS